ncbi:MULTISPECIES: hypothetical protein [Campylobacter]|uniref:hypothetical protein n=1 Tax=Campylobacter TaxID=194 RepID=UPI00164DD637|nr:MULTISPECIES: hypothetical protein [Campylobacter]WKW17956.1 hypothetical protein IXZ25_03510 [Campylobacter fetus subsp. fetus]EGK8073891.1 hypothetical protein [Campylobacter fetus]EGK8172964.1 hypothetical protein [Campylobacter fetus]HDX6332407.1 hypothetical protein [Campylobacter fetus]HEF4185907.1 hypothetical protein [Campylobacter fetus]
MFEKIKDIFEILVGLILFFIIVYNVYMFIVNGHLASDIINLEDIKIEKAK